MEINIRIPFSFGFSLGEYFLGCVNKRNNLMTDVYKTYRKLIDLKGDVWHMYRKLITLKGKGTN